MKKGLFTFIVTLFTLVTASQAQLLSFGKKNTDEHLRYSDYKPQKTKKENKALKEEIKRQKALSYSPQKSNSEKESKDRKEAKYTMHRLKRSLYGTDASSGRENKALRKEVKKKFNKQEKQRQKKVKQGRKNYGTKQTRQQFRTDKSEKGILDSDQPKKPLIKF